MSTTTHTATLTDRYIDAALRHVPAADRADLELELRGSIQDAVDARIDDGHDPAAAEVEALTELGDPERLAAQYTGRIQQLLGPAVYGDWWRLLRLLLGIVVPIVAALAVVGAAIDGDDPLVLVGTGIGAAWATAIQVAFWTTLVFAVIERVSPGGVRERADWSPDDLPEVVERRVGVGDVAGSLITIVLTIAAMLWQRGSTLVTVDGDPVPILDPDGWSSWWPALIAVLVAEAVLTVVVFQRGAWSTLTLSLFVALQVAFLVPSLWLLSQDRFFNPAFVDAVDWGDVEDPGRLLSVLTAALIVGITAWDVAEKVWRQWRSRRPAAAPGVPVA